MVASCAVTPRAMACVVLYRAVVMLAWRCDIFLRARWWWCGLADGLRGSSMLPIALSYVVLRTLHERYDMPRCFVSIICADFVGSGVAWSALIFACSVVRLFILLLYVRTIRTVFCCCSVVVLYWCAKLF